MMADQLVGRVEEVRSLRRLLDECDGGCSRVVGLVGETGIGKTRLLGELRAQAESRGHLVLVGSASEFERDLPFSVFVDAFDEYLEGLEPVLLDALDHEVRSGLAHTFPSVSHLAAGEEAAGLHERYRVHRAVRVLLEHLAERRPVVLLLDDFHWADPASAELFGALLRRPPSAAVLISIAFRPRQMPERTMAELERFHRGSALTRIDLHPLTSGEVRQFLGEMVDAADASVLYEQSGGNPFYLEQLARSPDWARADVTATSEFSWTDLGVPAAVATSLSEELVTLSEGGRLVLDGAAVAGDPFEPELAAAAAAVSETSAIDAIDELLRLDLIRTTDVPRRFRFRHPLVRRAVYEATAGGWRLSAHERCAAALAARGAGVTSLAHHVERSAREGDLTAVALMKEAGEMTLRLAPANAARWFADALRLLPQTAPAHERVELLLSRARALTAAGCLMDSHRALLDALEIAPDDSDELRITLTRACAGVESNLGKHEQACRRLENLLAGLIDPDSREAVALRIDLAMSGFWRACYGEMREWAEEAVGVSRRLGDAPLTSAGIAVLALANSMMGEASRAESDRSEAAVLVDSLPDDELARRLDAAVWLAGAELYLDRYPESEAHAERALDLGRATGQGELFLVLVQILGRVWFVRGELAKATELLDGGIEAARLRHNEQALVWNLFNRSAVALAAGEVDLALATARESVDLSRDLPQGFHSAWAAVRLAGALLETGQPGPAVELLLERAGGEELVLIPGSWRAYCLELLTRGRLALGSRLEAKRAAASAAAWASAVRLPLAAAWADRAVAAVHLDVGEAEEAAEKALASATTADEVGAPIEAALSRALAGRALALAGHSERAAEELQRAVEDLDACGALRYRDHAERELRKGGHRIHRRSRPGNAVGSGVSSLTERELQVARLVVDRRTNPEIAAELFISRKTVETHLRNIFHKVGVISRVGLARAVEAAEHAAEATTDH